MKKLVPIIFSLALVKLCIHLIGNRNYGFHRDELLHLAVSEHPAWGYMEFPPFIAWVGKLATFLFGYSLWGMRLFPTLAGIAILIICCLIAKELGGKSTSVLLAGTAVLAFLPYFRNHCLFQPVAFDQLFWTLGFYFLLRYTNTEHKKYLIFLGVTAGFALLNKYTALIWGVGIVVGLLVYEKGKLFRNKWVYISGALAVVMVLPNMIWQWQHHFPVLAHVKALKESHAGEIGPYDFALEQVKSLFTFLLALLGLAGFLFNSELKKYKFLGVAFITIFIIMWVTQARGYYFFAAYPIVFAAGGVMCEKLFEKKPYWNYVVSAILIVPAAFFIPKAIPVLSIEKYVAYANLKPDPKGRYELTGDYADMFGWSEQVKLVDSVYRALPENEKADCLLLGSNYGEAGALLILGKPYNLPQPVSSHGSFWLWGTGKASGQTAILVGYEKETAEMLYENLQLVCVIKHPFAIDEENNIPVYIGRNPKINLRKIWPSLEEHVFD